MPYESKDQQSIMEHISNYTSILVSSASPLSQPIIESMNQFFDELLDETWKNLLIIIAECMMVVATHKLIQFLVLGKLRVSEQQHQRELFCDYLLQKTILLYIIYDSASNERSLWPLWYTTLGSILLLSSLCRDRFEYVSLTPATKKWQLIKISVLMGLLLITTISCSPVLSLFNKDNTDNQFSTESLFLLADSTYVLTYVISVMTSLMILIYDMRTNSAWENRSSIVYYSDLIFTLSMSAVDLMHYLHLMVLSHIPILIKSWCLIKIHTLVKEIRRRFRRHKNYLLVVKLLRFSMATKEELEKNVDDCAICWDEMDSARKLPCGHLFHNSCLFSWLEQDISCPICRSCPKGQPDDITDEVLDPTENDEEFLDAIRSQQRDHLFHFDSSRYTNNPFLSWLPTISIEGFM